MAAVKLRTEQSYADAGRQVVLARTTELFSRAENVLDLDDPERVHKMRVTTRRLRAALEVFRDCFPRAEANAVLREVKTLADVLGQRRDCDVLIELLDSLRAEARRSESQAIDTLVSELRGEQLEANELLATALRHVEDVRLEEKLRSLAR